MSGAIQPFEFGGKKVRTAGTHDAPLFCAADVCEILTLGDVSQACRRLDPDEVQLEHHAEAENKQKRIVEATRGTKRSLYVTESGLYSLIIGCEKPEAKTFKKWVTSEVLPALRRFGVYDLVEAQTRKQTAVLLAEIFPGLPSKSQPIFSKLIHALLKVRREENAPGNPVWARTLASLIYGWAIPIAGQQAFRRDRNGTPSASSTDHSMLSGAALDRVKEVAEAGTLFAGISFSWADWREKMEVSFGGKRLQSHFDFKLLTGGKK